MRGIIVCPRCGDGALYDTDYGDMAIHEYFPGPFLFPTNVCYLNVFQRWRSRRRLMETDKRRNCDTGTPKAATVKGKDTTGDQNHPGRRIEARLVDR